jgi:hypothetical protein
VEVSIMKLLFWLAIFYALYLFWGAVFGTNL